MTGHAKVTNRASKSQATLHSYQCIKWTINSLKRTRGSMFVASPWTFSCNLKTKKTKIYLAQYSADTTLHILPLRNLLFCNRVSRSIVWNPLFHCFRHYSLEKVRPELLKMWFLEGGSLKFGVLRHVFEDSIITRKL